MCTPLKRLHLELNTPLLLMPSPELRHEATLSTKKAGKYDCCDANRPARNSSFAIREEGEKDAGKAIQPSPLVERKALCQLGRGAQLQAQLIPKKKLRKTSETSPE